MKSDIIYQRVKYTVEATSKILIHNLKLGHAIHVKTFQGEVRVRGGKGYKYIASMWSVSANNSVTNLFRNNFFTCWKKNTKEASNAN